MNNQLNIYELNQSVTNEINTLCSRAHLAHNTPNSMSLKDKIKWLVELKMCITKMQHCTYCNYDNDDCICMEYCSYCDQEHNGFLCNRHIMNTSMMKTIMSSFKCG